MFNEKKPGHTYFQHSNAPLFGSVKSAVKIAAADFPVFPEGKNIGEVISEAKNSEGEIPDGVTSIFDKVADKGAIALTVVSETFGRKMGGTIILNEDEQNDLILGILERRGKKGIGKIIERIGLELPEEGIIANSGTQSKFCPTEDNRLPGEEGQDDIKNQEEKDDCECPACTLRRSLLTNKGKLEVKIMQIGGRGARDGGPGGALDDLLESLGDILRRR